MTETVEKEIIAIIADIAGVEEEDITPETNFLKDLDIDSIRAIEITVAIEKKFKISVRDEDVPKITYRAAGRRTGQQAASDGPARMTLSGKAAYDAIIIGAGIGGLVCGCYLAKAGMKVLIAEQHSQPGGYCTSFQRKGFSFRCCRPFFRRRSERRHHAEDLRRPADR